MKMYLSPDGKLYAYEEDGSQDYLIPKNYTPISEEEFQAIKQKEELDEYNAYMASLTYKEKRAAEYPSMFDYLDGVVKGDQAQIDAYIATCLAIKQKYPKP